QLRVQPQRGISTPPCVFPTESTTWSQNQSSPSDLHSLSEVQFQPTPLLFSISPPTPEKKRSSTLMDSGSSHRRTIIPLSEPPKTKTNHRDPTTCENPLQLQARLAPTCRRKLSWFWVKELRIADPILDWEKMKRTMSDGLLLNTPKNNNSSVTMRTLLLDSSWETYLFDKEMLLPFTKCSNTTPTSPPKPPYQYFQRKKVLFQGVSTPIHVLK
ncbi:hypothetical protein A2U01_0017355, partial [Trifolium medium]|nr:hypothetical protein [Trifolium medium]